ncbi:hypothetical protein FB2170_11441 [Maribacter sp. HTCC2170]|nr:hypothetical protein FB2170_11441 [Maribacter sp. HTCC2170]
MNYLSPQIEAFAKRKKPIESSLIRTENSCGIFQQYNEEKKSEPKKKSQ